MSNLSGKVALVTGGSRGIGAAIARRLAAEGADVAISFAKEAAAADKVIADIEAQGRKGLAIVADSSDPEAVRRAVVETVKGLGRLDILINNAGVFPFGPFEAVSLEEYDRTMAIHARAAFVAAQEASRHMRTGGRIIAIGSNLGERVPFPGVALYAMSKSALIGFTKVLARDLGPRGITVNLVQPGSTETDMNPSDGASADEQRGLTALGQFGSATDVAAAVAYLSSDGARQVTGASFLVDGGANA
ncbi:3-oxoacyl-ACP reductase FabG [Nordella sp. HKS 07]|uniref:SDR family NAD(P)-dependent oxidoreductase n=1 Tax=Nordella sp. HKS 07 TaxID=2712222 RepID=UPI0013E1D880|nr:3-oxoacyl-ACP reductase family protein [Nordella sp. HKS 07]QIG47040.1 3-oxoacyl-ACP reductase FabG [Nordella sp. HKS 07]